MDNGVLSISWTENGATKTDVMASGLRFPSWESSNTVALKKTTTSKILLVQQL